MKNSLLPIILVIMAFLLPSVSQSQDIREFPKDTTTFIKVFEDYLKKNISDNDKLVLDQFILSWNTRIIAQNDRDSIMEVANLLLKKNARRFPHFIQYLRTILTYANKDGYEDKYHDFERGLFYLFESQRNPIPHVSRYMNNMEKLLTDSALNFTYSIKWYINTDDYQLKVDNGIFIYVENTNLKCQIKNDSINLYETKGVFNFMTQVWNGEGGYVNWERAGYDPSGIVARFNKYSINMTRASYSADSVSFQNKLYFDEPILGRLKDEVVHIISPEKAIFPEFESYQKQFAIVNIYENVNYYGGLIMQGANLNGYGTKDDLAMIEIYHNDTLVMKATSEDITFGLKRAVSNNARVVIGLDNDSIYHPGIMFAYTVDDKEVSLMPTDRIISKGPYYDSYHNITMKFNRLLWNIGTDEIFFTRDRISSIGTATYTSSNFYNLLEYERIQMRDDFHPLVSIKMYSQKVKRNNFSGEELAKYLMYPSHQIQQMLMFLSMDGFLFYDADNDEAIIGQRLLDYIDSRLAKIDYDVISFTSEVQAPTHNGTLNVKTKELLIHGVSRIFLSDSQNVYIYPKYRQINLKKNRSFDFGGIVSAGLFTFFGDGFFFDYENFKIDLNSIDSVKIRIRTDERDMYGQYVLESVQNAIEMVTGNLLIDAPDNKSGLVSHPQYPIFNSLDNSFVYYDKPTTLGGVYKRDTFYFEMDPFTIDSLDNFSTSGLKFSGNFYSASIFPPFEDSLVYREDRSLGFRSKTPPQGYPIYQGKGNYYNIIDLSNQGLIGEGRLEYLSAIAESENIVFYPDSTAMHATTFNIAQRTEGIEYPEVASEKVDIKWYPYDNKMFIGQNESPFAMYNGRATLKGSLYLTPKGLSGSGIVDVKKAILESNNFDFGSMDFSADTSTFKLRNIRQDDFTFITDNLKSKIDFTNNIGNFRTNGIYSIAEFPKNLYISYLNQFDWSMDNDIIEINSNPDVDNLEDETIKSFTRLKDGNLPGALYLSKHKGQDSLRFSSSKATYNVNGETINATEVEFIKVADAKIFPREEDIRVGPMAKMDTLREAYIIANDTNQHHIYEAIVSIEGRNNYKGSGDYTYIDEDDTEQIIRFQKIRVDSSIQTVATATMKRDDGFKISPVYDYYGDISLFAKRTHLYFDGATKIDFECDKPLRTYFQFESEINPDSIYIPITNMMTSATGRGVHVGSYITKDSTHIYSTFLNPRRDPSDEHIIGATGYLHYQKNGSRYRIADDYKHLNLDTVGNVVTLNKNYCLLNGSGKINLGVNLGQVKLNPAGEITHKLNDNEIRTELTIPMNFFFSEEALDSMVVDILSNTSLGTFNIASNSFTKKMNEIVGIVDANKFKNEILMHGMEAELPNSTNATILLGDVKFKWRTKSASCVCYGPIGITTINNRPVNRYVNGYMEFIKRRSGDLMRLYILLPNGNYYYFSYSRAVMQALSNNEDFVDAIQAIKKNKRKLKATSKKETPYRYIIATNQNMGQFLTRIQRMKEEDEALKQQKEALEGNQ